MGACYQRQLPAKSGCSCQHTVIDFLWPICMKQPIICVMEIF